MEYTHLPDFVKNYLFYLLTIKGRSQQTINGYATDLYGFLKFIKLYKEKNKVPEENAYDNLKSVQDISIDFLKNITLLDVYEYLNFTMQVKKNSDKARARKVSSIRGLFKYLTVNMRLLNNNPVENLEMPSLKKTVPRYLDIEQSKNLLYTILNQNDEYKYRDYCIITLFLNCGMRLSELTNININDFNINTGTLKLLGKGNKERVVFLNQACKESIQLYLDNDRSAIPSIIDKNALFISKRTKKRIGKRQIQNIVDRRLQNAGLSNMGFSAHKLRHTAATLLYQYGHVDILVLKEILGHANVGTTEIYTHVADDTIKNEIEKNPLSDSFTSEKDNTKQKN